jgi:hypothetical protein
LRLPIPWGDIIKKQQGRIFMECTLTFYFTWLYRLIYMDSWPGTPAELQRLDGVEAVTMEKFPRVQIGHQKQRPIPGTAPWLCHLHPGKLPGAPGREKAPPPIKESGLWELYPATIRAVIELQLIWIRVIWWSVAAGPHCDAGKMLWNHQGFTNTDPGWAGCTH